LKQQESSFNPEATKIVKDIEEGRDIILDQANIALFSGNIQVEPTTFDHAWNHADPRTEIIGELQSRKSLMVWKARRFGKLSRKKTFQKGEVPLKTNGYLRLSKTALLEQDLLPADTAKFQALTSMKVLLL
jgi:hypothetical protein